MKINFLIRSSLPKWNIKDLILDHYYDFIYGVKTCERNQLKENRFTHYDYEPARYSGLKRIFSHYKFQATDHLVDFGCGKGRVLVMGVVYGCPTITGVEINKDMYKIALKNIDMLSGKHKINSDIRVVNTDAQGFAISHDMNKFFFFNPFHLKVFIYVMKAITNSIRQKPRNATLFFYGPRDSTIKLVESLVIYQLKEICENPTYVVYEYSDCS